MKQKMSQWPALSVRIPPEVLDRLTEQAEERALPVAAIVREVLRAYRPVDTP
jgi:predicted DNA-binding protein